MSFWQALKIGESALSAQRLRMDVIANNIANAQTTSTETGGPYQRQDVVFQAKDRRIPFANLLLVNRSIGEKALGIDGVAVSKIVTDETPGQTVYEPTNPDANKDGFVTYPNVNLVVEMTNMMSASRSYEASLAVMDTAKSMAMRAIEIAK